MTRVQIPAYTDRWMMGDRYGEIVKVTKMRDRDVHPQLGTRAAILTSQRWKAEIEIAHVRLDISGKTVRVILDDCRPV
jgi:hypothetical protein